MGAKKLKTCKKSDAKHTKQVFSDIELNQVMQTVEEIKTDADKKLKEISSICINRECDGKQR